MDTEEIDNIQLQNSEQSGINGAIPIQNYEIRPIISPTYEPSDLNPVHVLLYDKGVFDCSICIETLSFPVFQVFFFNPITLLYATQIFVII